MLSASRAILTTAIAVIAPSLVFAGAAWGFDLNGAWATDPDQCSKVFERKADGIAFSDASDVYGSGFVIDGKKVIGKTARCTIDSTREDGTTINFLASCATEIMYQNIQFSLKIINDNTVNRIFPGMPEMSITYARCPSSGLKRSS